MFWTIIVFIIVLGILVFVHELGHFIAAKLSGVTVSEFAFGFRPRIWGIKWGETEYAINAIPAGGYVSMLGEDKDVKSPRSFTTKPKPVKAVILVAGVIMNFVLAWLIFTIVYLVGFEPFFMPGMATSPHVNVIQVVKLDEVMKNTPAAKAGMKVGDIVLAINGQQVKTISDLQATILDNLDKQVDIKLERQNQPLDIKVVPRSNPPVDEGAIGVALAGGKIGTKVQWAPIVAVEQTGRMAKMSVQAFGSFIKTLFVKRQVSPNVTGIVGIGAATGVARQMGFLYLMQFVALISVSLGVINLLPIVPLDGGHVLMLVVEAVRRKKLTDNQMQWISMAGLGFILLIFLVVTYHDILRFGVVDYFKNLLHI